MDKGKMEQQVKNVFGMYKVILILGSFGGIAGGLIGEYALTTKDSLLSGVVGVVIGVLIGYMIGFTVKHNKTVLGPLSSINSWMNIVLALIGILIGIGGAAVSFIQQQWLAFVSSGTLALCGAFMAWRIIKKTGDH
jgi:hypothetical protein